jgi:hypothetical protein
MERYQQKWRRIDELTQSEWGKTANSFRERDLIYGTAKLNVPAVIKHQIGTTAAILSLTAFGENMQTGEIVREQLHMQAVTSQPECSQIRQGLEKPQ